LVAHIWATGCSYMGDYIYLEMASTFPHVLANNFTHPVKKIISPFLTIFYMTPHSGRTHEHGVITDLATPLS
jgi:hypothetical protein